MSRRPTNALYWLDVPGLVDVHRARPAALSALGLVERGGRIAATRALSAAEHAAMSDLVPDEDTCTQVCEVIYDQQARLLLGYSPQLLCGWLLGVVQDGEWDPVPRQHSGENVADDLFTLALRIGHKLRQRLGAAAAECVNQIGFPRKSAADQDYGAAAHVAETWLGLVERFRLESCVPAVRSLVDAKPTDSLRVRGMPLSLAALRVLSEFPDEADEETYTRHLGTLEVALHCYRTLVDIDTGNRPRYWDACERLLDSPNVSAGVFQGLATIYLRSQPDVSPRSVVGFVVENLAKPQRFARMVIPGVMRAIREVFPSQRFTLESTRASEPLTLLALEREAFPFLRAVDSESGAELALEPLAQVKSLPVLHTELSDHDWTMDALTLDGVRREVERNPPMVSEAIRA